MSTQLSPVPTSGRPDAAPRPAAPAVSEAVQHERYVLGAVMLSRPAIGEVAAVLTATDFYRGAHSTTWETVLAMYRRGDAVDPVTVADDLEQRGLLAAVGGALQLMEMVEETPTAANVLWYARKVAESAKRRRLAQTAERLRMAAADASCDLDAAVSDAVSGLYTDSAARDAMWTLRGQLLPATEARIAGELPPAFDPGLGRLGDYSRIEPGYLTVVTGPPGCGKSECLNHVAVHMAKTHDWRFAFYSPENSVSRGVHTRKLLHAYTGIEQNINVISQPWYPDSVRWVDDHFSWIPDTVSRTVDSILAAATVARYQRGIDGLVIDPWNRVRHDFDLRMSETQYIATVLERILEWSRRHAVATFVVAHPTKPQRYTMSDAPDSAFIGSYKVTQAQDVSGSAHWWNMADNVWSVWRLKLDVRLESQAIRPSTVADVHVQKVREQPDHGHEGSVTVMFEPTTRRYVAVPAMQAL